MGKAGDTPSLSPWRGMLLYLALGVAWVFVGDALLAHWVADPVALTRFQTWKGWGYVALTSAVAWWLLRRSESRERLAATVVENTREGVMVTDAESCIVSVNAAVTRLLGYTEAELLGTTPRTFQSGRHDNN